MEEKISKPTKKQLEAKEEKTRQKIALNLDNYELAASIALSILDSDVSDDVSSKANEVLLGILDKITKL